MTPDQLTAASFTGYSPQARQFAIAHLGLLQQLPIAVAPAFLREIIVFDLRFPAERRTFERQCVWLESLDSGAACAAACAFPADQYAGRHGCKGLGRLTAGVS